MRAAHARPPPATGTAVRKLPVSGGQERDAAMTEVASPAASGVGAAACDRVLQGQERGPERGSLCSRTTPKGPDDLSEAPSEVRGGAEKASQKVGPQDQGAAETKTGP